MKQVCVAQKPGAPPAVEQRIWRCMTTVQSAPC